jgi:RNA polymerase-binding transcription factor DksA
MGRLSTIVMSRGMGVTAGICDNCGKDIAPERVQALPQAALCIHCKGRQETQRR